MLIELRRGLHGVPGRGVEESGDTCIRGGHRCTPRVVGLQRAGRDDSDGHHPPCGAACSWSGGDAAWERFLRVHQRAGDHCGGFIGLNLWLSEQKDAAAETQASSGTLVGQRQITATRFNLLRGYGPYGETVQRWRKDVRHRLHRGRSLDEEEGRGLKRGGIERRRGGLSRVRRGRGRRTDGRLVFRSARSECGRERSIGAEWAPVVVGGKPDGGGAHPRRQKARQQPCPAAIRSLMAARVRLGGGCGRRGGQGLGRLAEGGRLRGLTHRADLVLAAFGRRTIITPETRRPRGRAMLRHEYARGSAGGRGGLLVRWR